MQTNEVDENKDVDDDESDDVESPSNEKKGAADSSEPDNNDNRIEGSTDASPMRFVQREDKAHDKDSHGIRFLHRHKNKVPPNTAAGSDSA